MQEREKSSISLPFGNDFFEKNAYSFFIHYRSGMKTLFLNISYTLFSVDDVRVTDDRHPFCSAHFWVKSTERRSGP
jgi:hypothetical protein